MAGLTESVARAVNIGVDVGGTFTDAVMIGASRLWSVKVPTTREDHGVGVIEAITGLLNASGTSAARVSRIAHGMTVGTNALLEGQLSPTALVATDGFWDILELRRQNRADLYRLDIAHPLPVVPRSHVIEARERCGPDGVIRDLSPEEGARIASAVCDLGVQAVAVALLFSFRHPAHERRVADAVRALLPDVHVSISSEVLGEIREYERTATTAVDAALTPVLRRYLSGLTARTAAAGLPAPDVMQSNGGLIDIDVASRHASRTVLSGPAAGVIGAALWARTERISHALTFDMGGTSCDVALIAHGEPGRTSGTEINGHPLHLPMLDIQTVSAGGGSIAWADSGGALRVGPRSAGARPGPASYGLGGDQPTLTDAHVVLGRLSSVGTPGAEITLDRDRAIGVVGALAGRLGLELEACAAGMLAVANNEMARALRVVSVERGVHPGQTVVIAFGGAGPLHACEVGELLGIRRVLAPGSAGVLAALGAVIAGERRDWARTVLLPAADADGIAAALGVEIDRAQAALPDGVLRVAADCRFVGQSHSLTVPWDAAGDPAVLAAGFRDLHARRYGDADPDALIEIVTIRVAVERVGDVPAIAVGVVGPAVAGPVTLEMSGATLWIPAGWRARACADGSFDVRRDGEAGEWTP
jgi:N-methylhydantoinase A/oxoprolinase/acetone carboxylase beta subunit